MTPPALTWTQALSWRLRRQTIEPPQPELGAVEVARRLCGVQAQVPSAAELAVAVRTGSAGIAEALDAKRLVRTWTVRGTLHVAPLDVAARQLSLLAAGKWWHKSTWQRNFISAEAMDRLAADVHAILADGPLTRDELVEAIGDEALAEHLRSGWSAVLKPLAWQGLLCQGPLRGRNVTFARPDRLFSDWPGVPEPDEAGPAVVRDHLAAFGPATMEGFEAWLLRGMMRKATIRGWFAALEDELATVDVEGREALVLRDDLDELLDTRPLSGAVHLLPGFDQYVLGPGTKDEAIIAAQQRAKVSRAGGWISPVVLLDGRVAGTWEPEDGRPVVTLFPGAEVPKAALAGAVDRMSALL